MEFLTIIFLLGSLFSTNALLILPNDIQSTVLSFIFLPNIFPIKSSFPCEQELSFIQILHLVQHMTSSRSYSTHVCGIHEWRNAFLMVLQVTDIKFYPINFLNAKFNFVNLAIKWRRVKRMCPNICKLRQRSIQHILNIWIFSIYDLKLFGEFQHNKKIHKSCMWLKTGGFDKKHLKPGTYSPKCHNGIMSCISRTQ